MKFTSCFEYTRKRADRKHIKMEWIEYVVKHPIDEEVQDDGRIRRWANIAEAENRCLRVVFLEDVETIHNPFFDRRHKEKS